MRRFTGNIFIATLTASFFLTCCSGETVSDKQNEHADSIIKKDTPNIALTEQPEKFAFENEFDMVSNIEQVDFCVPVPKGNYVNDDKGEYERAHFVFLHRNKKNDFIEIQGMFRADKEISIHDYFKNTYDSTEEEGKIIEKKELLKSQSIFYAKGYMNNKIYDERFIEITWFRKEDVVSYTANFSIQDTGVWNKHLAKILTHSSYCGQ